jgi:hypothetical protein
MSNAQQCHTGEQRWLFVSSRWRYSPQPCRAAFSLHDEEELRSLLAAGGFEDVKITKVKKALRLPPPDVSWRSDPWSTAWRRCRLLVSRALKGNAQGSSPP